jgi:hypothetical protein
MAALLTSNSLGLANSRWAVPIAVEHVAWHGPIWPPVPKKAPQFWLEVNVHDAAAVAVMPAEVSLARLGFVKIG